MSGRLAIDFGTSNTVLALWDHAAQAGLPIEIENYAHDFVQSGESVPVIPSLVHFGSPGSVLIGDQVRRGGLVTAPETFTRMKRYIGLRNTVRRRVAGREMSNFDAGRAFLGAVLKSAGTSVRRDDEVAMTVPVESFEDYRDWLSETAAAAGMRRVRLIDESSAALLGYGIELQPGNAHLMFDFGGGTLDVAVVLVEEAQGRGEHPSCRVLGKAGADLGGATIDGWLFEEVLRRLGRTVTDPAIREVSRALLAECERAKERLSEHERAQISVQDPRAGTLIADVELTRNEFVDLMSERDAFTTITKTCRQAIGLARERGYEEDSIASVLMVGGVSLIPCVRQRLREWFGKDRVLLDRPIDAVACGAAAFVAGAEVRDLIRHEYCLGWRKTATGEPQLLQLVASGTSYPSSFPVELMVKAIHDNQRKFELKIMESRQLGDIEADEMELVFDVNGAVGLSRVAENDQKSRHEFWMNRSNPTFLTTEAPARKGAECFLIQFDIDHNKRLLLTARDLQTSKMIFRGYPVVKLA